MQTPTPVSAHALALFSRERRRRRLQAFVQAFEREACPMFSLMLPPSPLASRFDDRGSRQQANPTAGR